MVQHVNALVVVVIFAALCWLEILQCHHVPVVVVHYVNQHIVQHVFQVAVRQVLPVSLVLVELILCSNQSIVHLL
jgi:hypothetical protein